MQDLYTLINQRNIIGRGSKFGDTQRVTCYSGYGYGRNLSENTSALYGELSQAFNIAQYGINSFDFNLTMWNFSSLYPKYTFKICVNTILNDSPQRIQQDLLTMLSYYLDDVSISFTGDNTYSYNSSTGQIDVGDTYNDQTPQKTQLSLWEQIFGTGSTVGGVATAGTLSLTTVALIIGVGYILVSSRK